LTDDLIKKMKDLLSGSISNAKEKELSDKNDFLKDEVAQSINEELVNNFMNQIMDAAWVEEDLKKTVAPSYFLKKSDKEYWLMNTQLKILTPIKGGVELIPIEEGTDSTTCMIGFSTYLIPNKLIECPGWN
jgi:hypothetical protein